MKNFEKKLRLKKKMRFLATPLLRWRKSLQRVRMEELLLPQKAKASGVCLLYIMIVQIVS